MQKTLGCLFYYQNKSSKTLETFRVMVYNQYVSKDFLRKEMF